MAPSNTVNWHSSLADDRTVIGKLRPGADIGVPAKAPLWNSNLQQKNRLRGAPKCNMIFII